MRKGLLPSVIVAGAIIMTTAPAVTGQTGKKSDDRRVMVVTGCIERSWIKVHQTDPIGSHTDRFRLRGNKDLLKVLTRDYNGHLVEVTGLLTDPGKTQGTGKTVQLGKKTKVYSGAREVQDVPPLQDPSLEVQSYRDLKNSCR